LVDFSYNPFRQETRTDRRLRGRGAPTADRGGLRWGSTPGRSVLLREDVPWLPIRVLDEVHLAGGATVVGEAAGISREVDIVERALAILEEESRSWVRQPAPRVAEAPASDEPAGGRE
jgi:hypothetical protein